MIFAELAETKSEVWDRVVNLGVHAPFHLVQAALPHMRQQAYGRIVLTTSGRAFRVADCVPGLAAYNVGKMAQVGLMVGVAASCRRSTLRSTPSPRWRQLAYCSGARPSCCQSWWRLE